MVSAWATLAAYLFMMVLSYFLGQKYYPIPYKTGKMVMVLLLLVAFSYISYYVFDANFWIGNALLLLFVGILVLTEKKSIMAMKK